MELDFSHLEPSHAACLTALIKKYWTILNVTPVHGNQCVIDTGNVKPILVKKIMYGPKETIIMRKSIAALAKVGQVCQIHDGKWLVKALLAAKPHQEHVSNIEGFVLRFFVNYIPLNQVTYQIAYPIPRCDCAVNLAFGIALFFWLLNALTGYHQLSDSLESQEKLAFQGTDTIKWTYTVMPFGLTNGPVTFIQMIHDLDSVWKDLAARLGLNVDDNTNTNIIADDIFNWAVSIDSTLQYMEWNANCRFARLMVSPLVYRKVVSSSNILNLQELMYCWMAIPLPCLNINCWITGPHQCLFELLPASLVSFRFIPYFKISAKLL
jgi:hypothetical protein